MNTKDWAVLLDLDDTLVITTEIEHLRQRRIWQEVYRSFQRTYLPEGTIDFLAQISRIAKVGVVTQSPRTYAEKLLAYHQLSLPVLVAYHDVVKHKPHPEPIIRAAELTGVPPHRCIYVGDRDDDVSTAIGAGANSVFVSWTRPSPKVLPGEEKHWPCYHWDEVLSRIDELIDG